MNNDHLMTPLKDLNLTNRFLFGQVMEDTGTLEDVLSIILEKDIHLLFPDKQKKSREYLLLPNLCGWMFSLWMKSRLSTIRKCRLKSFRSGKAEPLLSVPHGHLPAGAR